MGYLLYSLTLLSLILVTALYVTRNRWTYLVPVPDYVYDRLPSSFSFASSFSDDAEAGLTSSEFDLSTNISSGDSRRGLNQLGKREVRRIMKSQRVNFDEARRIYTEQTFARNNIGLDGRPRDPKFVSFS